MSELTPAVSYESPRQPAGYRPLSAWAVAAFIIAGIYAALLTIFSVVAFFTSSPLFLAIATLFIPAGAAVLALIGRRHIRQSEGTLGGAALTSWAWWLSLLFGLGYAAFYFGTFTAVAWQAQDFSEKWFARIREGKNADAFVLTLDPVHRKHDNPNNAQRMFERYGLMAAPSQKGPLSLFEESELVRVLKQGGQDLQIRSLGVKNWSREKSGYRVDEAFQIQSPEGPYYVQLIVHSSEGPEIEGRQWRVLWNQTEFRTSGQMKPFGMLLEACRHYSHGFATQWVQKWNSGDSLAAFLDTQPASARAGIRRGYACALLLSGLASAGMPRPFGALCAAAILTDDEAGRLQCLAGYSDFEAGRIVNSANFMALPSKRADIIHDINRLFDRPSCIRLVIAASERGGRPLPSTDERRQILVLEDIDLEVHPDGSQLTPAKYACEAALVIEIDVTGLEAKKEPTARVVGLQLFRGGTPPAKPRDENSGISGGNPSR